MTDLSSMIHACRAQVLGLFCVMAVHASESASDVRADRFGGGMAVQAGYVSVDTRHGEVSGLLFGLGGRLHFYLGRFLRIGGAGARVSMSYDAPGREGSYYSIGYGGLTLEFSGRVNRWRFSAGALAGAGGVDNLHIVRTYADDSVQAVLTGEPTFVAAPILTVEFRVSRSISLMLMGDWLFGPALGERHQFLGPRAHLGVLFSR